MSQNNGWAVPASGWGQSGWGNVPSSKGASTDSTAASNGWGKPIANPKQNGWGQSDTNVNLGTGWGNTLTIVNPFAKNEPTNTNNSDVKPNPTENSNSNTIEYSGISSRGMDLFHINIKEVVRIISFNFGTGQTFTSSIDPATEFTKTVMTAPTSTFQLPTPPARSANNENDDEGDNYADLVATALPFVEEKTGEEGEDILFNEKSKAFILKTEEDGKKKWAEVGIGEFHINHNKENNFYRITMRRDTQNIVCNTRIFAAMSPSIVSNKALKFLAQGGNSLEPKMFQFKDAETAKRACDIIKQAIEKL
ncbi:hypothetical protein TRFO_15889 [Tritrichomonas foetus]|uniref:RanBD1 domain-containing protein n=1 Tax=Tritrichomonas foetus TaxID=1144522 RepID=A0A1J4KVU2_9EUKA|nr:hypothetical protein TRFO_15889 [Tritrichomonas foetus]|eukprot:OHT13868.1 hypothetical protein TRFO_15889 [Tritrichomonas foetus]